MFLFCYFSLQLIILTYISPLNKFLLLVILMCFYFINHLQIK